MCQAQHVTSADLLKLQEIAKKMAQKDTWWAAGGPQVGCGWAALHHICITYCINRIIATLIE